MKTLLLTIFLLTTSCIAGTAGCGYPPEEDAAEARNYMWTFNTSIVNNMTDAEAEKIFGCYYQHGDEVYVYKAGFFSGKNKYILVRGGMPIFTPRPGYNYSVKLF